MARVPLVCLVLTIVLRFGDGEGDADESKEADESELHVGGLF